MRHFVNPCTVLCGQKKHCYSLEIKIMVKYAVIVALFKIIVSCLKLFNMKHTLTEMLY